MSRESKIFSVRNKKNVSVKVKEFESFGWELLSINGLDISMSRETQIKDYAELLKYEYEYESLIEERKNLIFPRKPKDFDGVLLFILILLLIFPGILYYIYKNKENNTYLDEHYRVRMEYQSLTKKIKEVCQTSRMLFYSKNE